jgi:hypothetical protein
VRTALAFVIDLLFLRLRVPCVNRLELTFSVPVNRGRHVNQYIFYFISVAFAQQRTLNDEFSFREPDVVVCSMVTTPWRG